MSYVLQSRPLDARLWKKVPGAARDPRRSDNADAPAPLRKAETRATGGFSEAHSGFFGRRTVGFAPRAIIGISARGSRRLQ
jgi:hypothetical protein